jgi:membrane protease YdiL (CAAX protease family)
VRRLVPWRTFAALVALGILAAWLALPRPVGAGPLLAAVGVVAGAAFGGLAAGRRIGLGAPFLDALLEPGPARATDARAAWRAIAPGAAWGTVLGAATLVLLRFAVLPMVPEMQPRVIARAALTMWQRCALAFEAGVLEEILYRLFAVSIVVLVLSRRLARPMALALAVAAAAVIFGVAHLPPGPGGTTPPARATALVFALNAAAGGLFGWLYVRRGVENAIAAHVAADFVLYVAGAKVLMGGVALAP